MPHKRASFPDSEGIWKILQVLTRDQVKSVLWRYCSLLYPFDACPPPHPLLLLVPIWWPSLWMDRDEWTCMHAFITTRGIIERQGGRLCNQQQWTPILVFCPTHAYAASSSCHPIVDTAVANYSLLLIHPFTHSYPLTTSPIHPQESMSKQTSMRWR